MIRQFQPEDAEDCSRLVHACIRLDPLIPAGAKQDLLQAESPAIMCERACLFYVAVCLAKANIAGVAGIDMNEIRLMFVAPDHRRKGIGASLLKHVEALAPPAFFRDVFVYASPGAVGFYEAQGYRSGGDYGFVLRDYTIPTIFMTKQLRSVER